jgi:hypothetical protein
MVWQRISTQAEADAFMEIVGYLHDGVLREAHIWTEHWVSTGLSMAVDTGLDTRVRMVLQRQWSPLSAVELSFEEVTRFNLIPSPENYGSSIQSATMLSRNGLLYWADVPDWRPEGKDSDNATWLSARFLQWRDASEWMGKTLHYDGNDPLPPSLRD